MDLDVIPKLNVYKAMMLFWPGQGSLFQSVWSDETSLWEERKTALGPERFPSPVGILCTLWWSNFQS